MAFRRRERPLSPQELRDKIFKEYSESWSHAEPHFGFLPDGNIFPLSAAFESEIFIVFALDAGDYITERTYEFLQFLRSRYPRLPWTPIVTFGFRYLFLKGTKFMDRYKHFPLFHTTALFLDQKMNLDRFKIDMQPTIIFFSKAQEIGKVKLSGDFETALSECEKILQTTLRLTDPGLPLQPVQIHKLDNPVDIERITISTAKAEGNWLPAEGAIVTDDPKATITAAFEGKHLRLISTLHPQARDSSKLHVLLNDKPVPQNLCGQHLKPDDKGHSVVEINRNNGLYELIQSPNPVKGVIKIQFISVIENPVIFYEFRSAN